MGTEIGRCGLVNGEIGERRTIPRTWSDGVGNAVPELGFARPISLAFDDSWHSAAAELQYASQKRMSVHRRKPLMTASAKHMVTFGCHTLLLECGDHLVGDAPQGIHHYFARDR